MADEPDGFEGHEVDPRERSQDRLPLEEVQATKAPEAPSKAPVPVAPGGEPDAPKPYVMPRMAAISIIPKRKVTIKGPEPYEAVEIELWINPPDGEVTARAASSRNLGDYMSHFILDWSLTDDQGNKLPIDEESMAVFPKELWDWMIQEFGEARMRPLVPPKDADTMKNQTPTPMNPSRNRNLNGTTS